MAKKLFLFFLIISCSSPSDQTTLLQQSSDSPSVTNQTQEVLSLSSEEILIKIFDAYRPVYVQKKLWEILPDSKFIAPPKKGSPHSRGVAIDLTLVDKKGKELNMGTEFDEFSRLSYHGCLDISKESYENRLLLLGIMTDSGWDFFRNEWWHYQLYNSKNFPIVNDI